MRGYQDADDFEEARRKRKKRLVAKPSGPGGSLKSPIQGAPPPPAGSTTVVLSQASPDPEDVIAVSIAAGVSSVPVGDSTTFAVTAIRLDGGVVHGKGAFVTVLDGTILLTGIAHASGPISYTVTVTALAAGTSSFYVVAGGVLSNTRTLTATPVTEVLDHVTIIPTTPGLIVAGDTLQLTETAYMANGSPLTVQPTPSWSVSAGGAIGSVNAAGLATASAQGGGYFYVDVSVSRGGVTKTSQVAIPVAQVYASLVVSPATVTIPAGGTTTLTAVGKQPGGADLTVQPTPTWSVLSGGTYGSVNASTGVVTGSAGGGGAVVVQASATVGGVTHTATATVTVTTAPVVYTTRGLIGQWRAATGQPITDDSGNGRYLALGSIGTADTNDPTYGVLAGSGPFLRFTTDDFARVVGPRFSVGSIQCILRKTAAATGGYLYGWCEQDGSGVESDSDKTLLMTATGVQFDCYLGGPKSLSATLANDTTAHVRAVADGTNLTLYVNNVQQSQIACGPTFDAWGAGNPALTIGARRSSATAGGVMIGDAYIDDIVVHNVVPTTAELASDYAVARGRHSDLP